MPLDPFVSTLLQAMSATPQPKLSDLPAAAGREMYRQMTLMVDDNAIDVGDVTDRAISGPHGPIPVREYLPVGAPAGTLVWFHGGGFVIGDLSTHDGLCRRLCRAGGIRVVAVDYRMAPEHRFPAAVDDCAAAWAWAQGAFGDKLAVGGDSAGGNLAAVIARRAVEGGSVSPRLQVLCCPWLDPFADSATGAHREFASGFMLEQMTLDWFRDQYVGPGVNPKDPDLAPLCAADLSRVAPAYILTAEFDPLRDEGRAYADKLKAAGVAVTYVEAPGMIHNFYCMTRMVPAGPPALDDVAKALVRAFQ